MAAASAWKGAVEFAGFPVNVKLYGRTKSRSGESFKTLAPNGDPVRSVYIDSDGEQVERAECSKGVETSKGQFTALSTEAIESIASAEKSSMVTPSSFAPLDSIPLELATAAYAVVPDSDVAGADKSVGLIWNGLLDSGLAYNHGDHDARRFARRDSRSVCARRRSVRGRSAVSGGAPRSAVVRVHARRQGGDDVQEVRRV